MTSELPSNPARLFVWVWLPGLVEPIPAGVLERHASAGVTETITFAYGRSYLAGGHPPIYLPELPLQTGRQEPPAALDAPGVVRDAAPDAWGQRVIMQQLLARDVRDRDTAELGLLTYLLHSGSDRPGALDFQLSASEYLPRLHDASVADLLVAADAVQAGELPPPHLGAILVAGSSMGGARPKSTLRVDQRPVIAKFSSPSDNYPVMRGEALAMELARRVGVTTAATSLIDVGGRDVLLVERFDRSLDGTRRSFVSALTLLGLHELAARHASYADMADLVRRRFVRRGKTLHELFLRIVVNVLVSNTDDHARNHAAFYDQHRDELALTPAFDICPQLRTGQEATQAMAIGMDGQAYSQLMTCLDAAAVYDLTQKQARELIDHAVVTIAESWHAAADEARLTRQERDRFWGTQVCNPYAFYDYAPRPPARPTI